MTVRRRRAGPPRRFTPRSQSDTKRLLTLRYRTKTGRGKLLALAQHANRGGRQGFGRCGGIVELAQGLLVDGAHRVETLHGFIMFL